jgi:two-component system phosphate regulon response regulator PhoB
MFPSEHPRVAPSTVHGSVARVLVIDGDATLRAALASSLTSAGYEVEAASSGQAGLALARASRPDVVLFDLRLPDIDGLELCRALRSELRGPSLCVLSAASEESDRVTAFEAGVDDYVTKPHSMRELILRIRSLSRRRSAAARGDDSLRIGALRIDRAARRVEVDGARVELTRRELDLLVHLADRAGRVQTRDMLLAEVWGDVTDSGRVVDTTIKRLRKKLGPLGPAIRTVRGVGYELVVK